MPFDHVVTRVGSRSAALPATSFDARAVLELACLVDDPDLATKLEEAHNREVKVRALTIPERETILRALEDPRAELAELRGVLLRELEWLRQEGLA